MISDWGNQNVGTDAVQSNDEVCVVAEVDGDHILINDGGVIIAIDEWAKDLLERD